MNGSFSPVKHGFVDLAAVFFVIGGVVSLIMTVLTLPISSVYPLNIPSSISMPLLVVLGISIICSLGAIHCFSLATKRMLSEAGVRGIVFGALLLIFSLGLFGNFKEASSTATLLNTVSAFLILIAGSICFVLRHTMVSASAIARQHAITQPSFQ